MYVVLGCSELAKEIARVIGERGPDAVLATCGAGSEGVVALDRIKGPPPAAIALAPGADEDPKELAAAAGRRWPGVPILLCGHDFSIEGLDAEVEVLDGRVEVARAAYRRVDRLGRKHAADRLAGVLESASPPVGILLHDNPDPDALASAMAFAEMCGKFELERVIYYGGSIGYPDNRDFVNMFQVPLTNVNREGVAAILPKLGLLVMLDVSIPGDNNVLPPGTVPNVVIDHHSTSRDIGNADHVDVRPDVGATSTIMTDYLQLMNIPVGEELAAALFHGIRTDTWHFTRNTSTADMMAVAYLSPLAAKDVLRELDNPAIPAETLDIYSRAIQNRVRLGSFSLSCVEFIENRDLLPQAAEFLLREAGVETAIVYGIIEMEVFLSARSNDPQIRLGDLLKQAFAHVGSAGGHVNSAGAQLPLHLIQYAGKDDQHLVVNLVKNAVQGMIVKTAGLPAEGAQ